MTDFMVKKRDGRMQPFEFTKIEQTVKKAGGSVELAGQTAYEFAGWLKETAKSGVVTTVEIEKKLVGFVAGKNADVASGLQKFVKRAV